MDWKARINEWFPEMAAFLGVMNILVGLVSVAGVVPLSPNSPPAVVHFFVGVFVIALGYWDLRNVDLGQESTGPEVPDDG